MLFYTSLLFASTATATLVAVQLTPRGGFAGGLEERQYRYCGSVPEGTLNACSVACGAGFESCVNYDTCFNPGRGDVCCSDGQYCDKGYYCADVGCCPDGVSLAECGATSSISTVPALPRQSASSPAPAASSSPKPTTSSSTSTSAVILTSSSAAPVAPSSSAAPIVPSSSAAGPVVVPSLRPTSSAAVNGTVTAGTPTSSGVLQVTTNAAPKFDGSFIAGGLGLLAIFL